MNESVIKWLKAFEATPVDTLHGLVLGRYAVSAWSRASLREIFLEIFQTHAEQLDNAVAGWLDRNLLKEPPDQLPLKVWASHTQDVFQGVTGLPLPQVACLLRNRMRDFRLWLRPLRFEESVDSEAAYMITLAWAGTNRNLDGMWRAIALRQEHEPLYYTDVGLLGLRKTRDEHGKLPEKAPFLLLATLIDLADNMPHKDWELTTRAILGGYHYSLETWVREFEPALKARPDTKNGGKWLKRILPQLQSENENSSQIRYDIPPAHTRQEKETMIGEVAKRGPVAMEGKLLAFLDRERAYANTTRNPHFLVRTFNRLAEAARSHDPEWAIARVEEALAWDEYNARNWTVLARCLWARSFRAKHEKDFAQAETDGREALDTLWNARFRFPYDPFVRTELAKMHRAANDLPTAEAIYREAIAEFPLNPWCFTGLADMLVSRSMQTENKADQNEARELFKRASELGGDKYAKSRLKEIKRKQPSILVESLDLEELAEGEVIEIVEFKSPSLSEMRPAQRLGRALLLQWQARKAASAQEKEKLFAEAEKLLDLSEALAGDCWTAFVEARGFLLLARNHVTEARGYFEQQLAKGRSLGLRLGFAEARTRLGEKLNDHDEAELASFGPEGSILPLVLKALRLLDSNDDATLREILLQIYPRARELAGMPLSELGEDEGVQEATTQPARTQTADSMMAHLLVADVFQPAKIVEVQNLNDNTSLSHVRAAFDQHRDEIFSVFEKLALAA